MPSGVANGEVKVVRISTLCLLLGLLIGGSTGSVCEPIETHSGGRVVEAQAYAIEGWGEMNQPRGSVQMVLDEFMIDTTISWFGAHDWQWSPSIAFDGTNYLVVWHDDRNGVDYGIYGARVAQTGEVLDPRGIVISDTIRDQSYPSVSFNGVEYFVVWQDYRNGADYDIYGARVQTSGDVLDPSGIPVSAKSTRERYPNLASDGTNYLVVWEDDVWGGSPLYEDYDITAARVDPFGNVLDPLGITVCDDTLWQRFPSVVFGLDNYLVVWDDGSRKNADIWAARIDTSGNVLDTSGVVVCSTSYLERSPAVGFDGRNYLVIWEHWWDSQEVDILGARMDTSGTVIDSTPALVCTLAYRQRHPKLAFGDSTYLVVWRHGRDGDICGATVDTLGRVSPWWIDSVAITDARGWQRSPAVAFDGTNHFVVWGDDRGLDGDVYGSRVKNWNVLDPEGIRITTWPDHKWFPAVASDQKDYFVVWQNLGTDGYDIWGTRVDESGSVLDPRSIKISEAEGYQGCPAVASSDLNLLVVWEDGRDFVYGYEWRRIYGSRVTHDGTVLDPLGIEISPPDSSQLWTGNPSVAFCGAYYFVAWNDLWEWEISAARVDTSGLVIDSVPIDIPRGGISRHGVACNGENYLVVWYGGTGWPNPTYYVWGARVSLSGEIVDSVLISTGPETKECVSVACGGVNSLVVWQDARNGPESDIYGARVDTFGSLLDTLNIPIAIRPGYQEAPSVAFDGDNYLVIWEDWETGESNIWGARVDTSGAVIDSGGIELVDQPVGRMAPSLAKASDNNVLLVYDGTAGYPYDGYRVFGALYTDVGLEEGPEFSVQGPEFALRHCAPNPFSASTTIKYTIPARDRVALNVYDSSGRLVSQLVAGEKTPGSHRAKWNGRDASGRELPSGIYFYRLLWGGRTATRKMILLR